MSKHKPKDVKAKVRAADARLRLVRLQNAIACWNELGLEQVHPPLLDDEAIVSLALVVTDLTRAMIRLQASVDQALVLYACQTPLPPPPPSPPSQT